MEVWRGGEVKGKTGGEELECSVAVALSADECR